MSREHVYSKIGEVIETEEHKVKAEVTALNEEKKQKQEIIVGDDDIIRLNIGGKKFTSQKYTLCQIEGSLFATIFSGQWKDSVDRDQDGAVYFDFNPKHFGVILNYLRAKRITTSKNPATVFKIPEDEVKNFKILVEYLGLSDEIVPPEIMPGEKFNWHSLGITLKEGGKVAVHNGVEGHHYVLGKNIYHQGVVNLKLRLESFQHNDWVFIGITEENVFPTVNHSCQWPGSHGWSLGSDGYLEEWKAGSFKTKKPFLSHTKQDDEVQLMLDFYAAKLFLHLTTGHRFHIDIPKNKTWRLNVTMYNVNDKIRIINEKSI